MNDLDRSKHTAPVATQYSQRSVVFFERTENRANDWLVVAQMPSARGFIKSSGEGLVGTFNVNGGARYLSVDVNLPNQLFECSNATLTYNSIGELIDDCSWSGTIGKVTLRMNLGEGVSITGPLDVPRPSSVRARGSGTWRTTATAPDQRNSAGRQQESGRNASADRVQLAPVSFDVPKDPRELERERWLLESGAPIIVYVLVHVLCCCGELSCVQDNGPIRHRKILCRLSRGWNALVEADIVVFLSDSSSISSHRTNRRSAREFSRAPAVSQSSRLPLAENASWLSTRRASMTPVLA